MEKFDVYKDIAKRTNGDIMIGVVGPVRTGKSTFITRFMNLLVTPNITPKGKRQIAIDEMPQSGSGKTITTTEPKFVPSEAVKIAIKNKMVAKVRLIDCVGYIIDGVLGDKENEEPRLVKTPWSKEPIPFEKAAAIGTEKVIEEHSTIGVMVTTDGSFTDIPRENYVKAEEKVVKKLQECKKPFVIILNCKDENSKQSISLASELTNKYGVATIPLNVENVDEDGILKVLECALMEFPLKSFDVRLPDWMQALPSSSELIKPIIDVVRETATVADKMKHHKLIEQAICSLDSVKCVEKECVYPGEGKAEYVVCPKEELFYKTLSEFACEDINSELSIISYVKGLKDAKENYKKLKDALYEAQEKGYGIVIPEESDMALKEPEVIRQGGRYGVKLKANTSCLHLIKVNLDAEVSPISGTEKQCKDFADFIKEEYEENPDNVWKTDVFGKPLSYLVTDEIAEKISSMKSATKNKMRKTVTKIVNEGKGRVICIVI